MREIKFRVWDNTPKDIGGKRMIPWDELTQFEAEFGEDFYISTIVSGGNKNLIAMQYTGLKDSVNIEEYYDDLIQESDEIVRQIIDGCSGVLYKNTKTGDFKYFWELLPHKVIGNIWEHSHLLEES